MKKAIFWSHKGKTNNPDFGNSAIFIPGCSYTAGPMYYFNRYEGNILEQDFMYYFLINDL
jgi:hypothetical protein